MGKTSNKAKTRWNAKNYDRPQVYLPKGLKDKLKASCNAAGVSMNSVFVDAAEKFIAEHPVPNPSEQQE